jgi:arylsulfatase A-like enzyme
MYGPWDAPTGLQRLLLDEGDPPPLESVIPPDVLLSEDADPDTAFLLGCCYAAQIMVLDTCWTGLMDVVRAAKDHDPWLTILIGVRGYPLGEHRKIGGVDARLYSEQLHVPWLIQFPGGRGRLARSSALVSHVDVLPTISEWTGDLQSRGLECDGDSVSALISNPKFNWRDALLATSRTAGSRAIRTTAWCLLQHADAAEYVNESQQSTCCDYELYVRPDDRWEANDVAKLCPDTVEQLALASDNLALQVGSRHRLSRANQTIASSAAQP